MVFIPRWEKYKDKKPSGLVEIDYAHELAIGISRWITDFKNPTNLVSGSLIPTHTTVGTPVIAEDYTYYGGNTRIFLLTSNDESLLYGINRGKNHTASVTFSSSHSSTSNQDIFGEMLNWAGDTNIRCAITIQANTGYAVFALRDAGWAYSFTLVSNVVVNDGIVHTATISYDDSKSLHTFYIDGVNVGSFIETSSGQFTNTSLYFGCRYGDTSYFKGKLYHADIRPNVLLSDDEIYALQENPYQILKPRQKFFVMSGMDGSVKKAIRSNQTISSISRSSEVVSVTLSASYPNNALKVGDTIVIDTDGGTTSFDGTHTIASVASQTSFTYNQPGIDVSGSLGASPTAGGHYASLSSWIAASQSTYPDLTSSDVVLIAECYNDWSSGLSDSVNITGFTTDATRNIIVRAASGNKHDGTPETGFWMFTSANNAVIDIQIDNVILKDLNIKHTATSLAYTRALSAGSVENIYIYDCIFINSSSAECSKLGASGVVEFINSLYISNTGTTFYITLTGGSNVSIYNCTGIHKGGGTQNVWYNSSQSYTLICKNTVGYSAGTGSVFDSDILDGTSSNCASSDSSATSTGSITGITQADFTDYDNNDFSIPSTSQLRDAGVDLSAEGFTTDILGNPRGV